MAVDQESQMREEARKSLERMQTFDVNSLPREDELGQSFSFRGAVGPAQRLIDLYKRLSPSALEDFPQTQLQQIRDRANEDFTRLDQILKFDPTQANAAGVHQQLIAGLQTAYHATFTFIHPFISYSLHKTADFQRLESEARSTLQLIRDQTAERMEEMKKDKQAAEGILADIRKVAAEQGVTQQAIYFKNSADAHEHEANVWQKYTVNVSIGLGIYALASLFFL